MNNITFSLGDLLSAILIIAGIVALIGLAFFLVQLTKTLKKVNKLLDDNEKDIKRIVADLPGIVSNVSTITDEAGTLVTTVAPDVASMIGTAKQVVTTVESTTKQVTDTVGLVSDSVADTTLNLKHNVASAQDYLVFVSEIVDVVRDLIKR